MCIHVRRGDRITNEEIDRDTRADNVWRKICDNKPNSVYIMTNRLNELRSLHHVDGIYFYTKFRELMEIQDNYYLFCVENNIMQFAKIRCSTFDVKKDVNNGYYHCSLSKISGFQ